MARCRPEFEAAIYEDVAWLGLKWEMPVRRQSNTGRLPCRAQPTHAMGLVYPSFESRAEIARLVADREAQASWPRDPDGVPLYPGHAKTIPPAERTHRITSGDPYAFRLDMQAALRRVGTLDWMETGGSPGPNRYNCGQSGDLGRHDWHARRCRPAITLR